MFYSFFCMFFSKKSIILTRCGFTSTFQPSLMVFSFPPLVLGELYIWDIILVMPSWLAGAEDQIVTVTVTTEDEVVSGDFEIKLLPLILEQYKGSI